MKKIFFVFLILCLNFSNIMARPILLMDAYSARSYGVGGSDVASESDLDSFLINPAGLALLKCISLSVFYLPWYEDMKFYSFNGGYPLLKKNKFYGTLGFNLSVFSIDPFPNYDEIGNRLHDANVSDFLFNIGYGYPIQKKINVGLNLKYLNTKLAEDHFNNFAFDVSALTYLSIPSFGTVKNNNNFSIGLSIQNIGFSKKFINGKYALPQKVRAGISHVFIKIDKIDCTLLLEYNKTRNFDNKFNSGIEVDFINIYKIRLGYKFNNDSASLFSFGVGMNNDEINNLSYDYSLIPLQELGVQHAFSIKIKFGETTRKSELKKCQQEMRKFYQDKEYGKTVEKIERILCFDPSNEEALDFREKVFTGYFKLVQKKKMEYKFNEAIKYLEAYQEFKPEDRTVISKISNINKIINDNQSPNILLKDFIKTDLITVNAKNFNLSGDITDNLELRSVKINNELIKLIKKNTVKINKTMELMEGENSIKVYAEDMKGNVNEKTIKIIYKIIEREP